jgi:hypothetical protein
MRSYIAVLVIGVSLALVGCTKSQSENCKKLIACSEALSPGTGASMETAYGKDGACWKSSEASDACTKACDTAMAGFKAMPAFGTTAACK